VAARLLRERPGLGDDAALAVLREAGLVRDAAEQQRVGARVAAARAAYWRSRVGRCLCESSGFTVRWRWSGREYRVRGAGAAGSWHHGGRGLRRAWIGQRVRQLTSGDEPVFLAYFQKWWWLGGGASLYLAARCSGDRFHAEVREATAASARAGAPQ